MRLSFASRPPLNRRDYWITQGMYPGIEPPVILGSHVPELSAKPAAAVGNYWQGREVIINPGLNWGDDPAAQSTDFTILGLPLDGTFATEVAIAVSQLHEKPGT